MPQPIVITQPIYYRWQAVQNRSHLYQVINHNNPNSGISLNVNVMRIDSQENSQVVISNALVAIGDSLDVDLSYVPATEERGDGLYQICVTPIQTTFNQQVQTIPPGRAGITIVDFPNTVNGSTTIDLINVGSTVIYNSATDGTADFSNPPTSLANATNAINDYLDTFSPPGPAPYSVLWVAPNATTPFFWDSPQPFWRLIIYTQSPTINIAATTALNGLQLTSSVSGSALSSNSNCLLFIPDIEPPTGYDFISSFEINGVNVLAAPINVNTELSLLIQAITDHLDTLGTVTLFDPNDDPGGNANINQYAWLVSPCSLITEITFMQQVITELPTECIYELELTDTFECFMQKYRQYQCLDPCCENCGTERKRAELFKLVTEMGLLYFSVTSLFQQIRFFYLGSTHNYDKSNTTLYDLLLMVSKLRKFVFECGYGCKEEKPCNCQ